MYCVLSNPLFITSKVETMEQTEPTCSVILKSVLPQPRFLQTIRSAFFVGKLHYHSCRWWWARQRKEGRYKIHCNTHFGATFGDTILQISNVVNLVLLITHFISWEAEYPSNRLQKQTRTTAQPSTNWTCDILRRYSSH